MARFVRVAKVDEIPPGRGKQVIVHEKPIALFNVDGVFYAVNQICPHMGGPLSEGTLTGKAIRCLGTVGPTVWTLAYPTIQVDTRWRPTRCGWKGTNSGGLAERQRPKGLRLQAVGHRIEEDFL